MIKYIFRKTAYKELDTETQDKLFQLTAGKEILKFLCVIMLLWLIMSATILSCILLLSISSDKEAKLSLTGGVVVSIVSVTHCFIVSLLIRHSEIVLAPFIGYLAADFYFSLYTRKGKALSKQDFAKIKNLNKKLYLFIRTLECHGYCYSTCFNICQELKKGTLEFLAVKKFPFEKSLEDDDGRDYEMHVLYVNNGWAFDTYSVRQYPLEKIHTIFEAKVCKTFSFEEIQGKTYEQFAEENAPEVERWADMNNCSISWRKTSNKT